VVGRVYCAVIAVCRGCLDLDRSAEWTELLGRWCDSQPDLVPFRGQCLVHRSEVLQVRGRWDDAAVEVEKVLADAPTSPVDVAGGMALYQRAELHRLRGEHRAAERCYRDALAAGHDPQPGLALLRLAQGRTDAALLALRRALDEARIAFLRVQLLPAVVEVAIAADDLTAAATAADELAAVADRLDSAYVHAMAAGAIGALALARGDARQALDPLRSAVAAWARLDAPYDGARCRLLLARACAALGDVETAELETEAARRVLVELGARHELIQLDGDDRAPAVPDGLTPREVEVLCLVASGASNRAIADRLVLSERTVARHVANIFVKIGVSARSAATAYAYDHHLV
jgi:ATP/maltotriose-dependent transcriptional regulator MalT